MVRHKAVGEYRYVMLVFVFAHPVDIPFEVLVVQENVLLSDATVKYMVEATLDEV